MGVRQTTIYGALYSLYVFLSSHSGGMMWPQHADRKVAPAELAEANVHAERILENIAADVEVHSTA